MRRTYTFFIWVLLFFFLGAHVVRAQEEEEMIGPTEPVQQIPYSPELALEHYELGISYGKQGKYADAIRELQQAIQYNHAYADAYNALAVVYHRQQRYQEAIEQYLLAIEADPKHVKARTNLALLYDEQEEYLKALRHLEIALEIYPAYEPARKLFEKVKPLANAQEAEENARLTTQAPPPSQKQPETVAPNVSSTAKALFDQGTQSVKEGNIDAGIRAYQEGLKFQPQSAQGYTLLGMAYREKSRITNDAKFRSKELEAFTKAIQFNPQYVPALLSLGEFFYAQKNISKAVPYFQQVLQYQPDHPAKDYLEEIIKQAK